MLAFTVIPLALAASALANVFVTNPVSSTTYTAGQKATVSWQDSGDAPTLAQFGNATFGIYVGNALQQTLLQTIAGNVNVSAVSSLEFTPDASIGPDSSEYFIRITSLSLMSSKSSQYPEEAFSAKFTMTGMTGTFNSTLQAEINGQSTAPIQGATSTSGSPSATGTSTGSKITSAPATSATSTSTANGAGKPVVATGFVALIATLVGVSFF